MNADFFKNRQKSLGITVHDLGEALGRDRTVVSRIYSGRQKMTLDEAGIFAEVLKLPIDQVIAEAGITPKRQFFSQTMGRATRIPGFAENDVAPFDIEGATGRQKLNVVADNLGSGVDIWRIQSRSLMLAGFFPNDFILVDGRKADIAKYGDIVIAQVYDFVAGSAKTVLRRYEKPVLVAASPDADDWGVHVVDENNVAIRGVVTASWREM